MMGKLLCMLGLHRPSWVSAGASYYDPREWLHARRCARCGLVVTA